MRWYDRETGEQVEGVTLREARRDGHLPSVTGVIHDMFHSFGLTRWRFKLEMQAVLDQVKCTGNVNEPLAAYEAKQEREQIMLDHTVMHERISEGWDVYNKNPKHFLSLRYGSIFAELDRMEISAGNIEQRLISTRHGYCGQPDAYGPDLIDWKFTTRGAGGYREKIFAHGIQLAAYNQLIPGGAKRWVNVVIGAKNPSLFRVIEWSAWEQAHLTEVWNCAFRLWCLRNKYDPRDSSQKMKGALQMKFKTRWEGLDPEQKKELAKRMNTTTNYLSQIANGHAKPSRALIKALVQTCEEYSPEDAIEDLLS